MTTRRSNHSFSTLAAKLDGHFGRCAAMAAVGVGGGAMVTAPQTADAAVVHSGPVNINIPSTTAGVYLNVVTGVSNTNPGLVSGWDLNPWSSTAFNMFSPSPNPGGPHVGTGSTYFNLAVGTLVSGASTFSGTGTSTISGTTPLNFNSNNNYVGFRFINEANSNQVHYGWMRIALGASASAQPRAIVEYAYESVAGQGITVPEPTSIGLLAMGAGGLITRRRRSVA